MKWIYAITIALLFLSCSDRDMTCQALSQALIDKDDEYITSELNPLLHWSFPEPSPTDMIGHLDNLEDFVDQMNAQCDNITFSLSCYGCVETYPVISEILAQVNGIERIIDIKTPEDDRLKVVGVH